MTTRGADRDRGARRARRCRDETGSRANSSGSSPGAQARHRRGRSPYPGSSLHLPAELGSVERWSEKPEVPGSTPGAGTQEWGARRSPCGDGPAVRPAPGTTEPGHVPRPTSALGPVELSAKLTWFSARRSSVRARPGLRTAAAFPTATQEVKVNTVPRGGSGNKRARDFADRHAGGAGPLALADADVAQQVERQASTLDVAGSIPVVRSRCRGTGGRTPPAGGRVAQRGHPGAPGVAPRARAEVAAPGTSAPQAPSGLGCWQARRGFGPRHRRGFDSCTRSEGRVRMARSAGGSSPVMAKTVNRVRSYAALPPEGEARAP